MSDSMNDLLDATLDDLEDLPEYKSFPAGAYTISVTLEEKEVNGHQSIEMVMTCVEASELADATETPPKQGDTSSVLFMMDNEFGRGKLKAAATPLAAGLGTSTIRELIEQCKDVECVAVLGVRKDKNDASKLYQNIVELQVV